MMSPRIFDHNELPVNQPEEFKKLSQREQAILTAWIRTRLTPRKTINHKHSSYGLKHFFEEDNFYVTNGAFKGAMLQCGFLPEFAQDTNWNFAISETSPAFKEVRYGCF